MSAFKNGNGTKVHAHKLIVETARAIAQDQYNTLMKSNRIYKGWREACKLMSADGIELTPARYEQMFIDEVFPRLIEPARDTLVRLLTTPISETLKIEIHDALIKDAAFRQGRLKASRQAARART